jgi:dTDP-4-amino-4,6-dideoxy-D-galactose acyltransferase
MEIRSLSWDSEFLGKKVGAIVLAANETPLLNEVYLPYDLLYFFSEQPVSFNTSFKELFICNAVDEKLTYAKALQEIKTEEAGIELLPKQYKVDTAFYNLAVQSGTYSRFAVDPLYPSTKFCEMYHLWLSRSLSGELADAVFAAPINSSIAGFITLKKKPDCGDIGLLAVDEQYRGAGIAACLMQEAEKYVVTQFSLRKMEVVTQAANTIACRFYEKCGYEVSRRQFIYHCWKK